MRSGSALLSLTVEVQSRYQGYDRGSSYEVDRTSLLDLPLGDEMLAILSRFPELRQLHFALTENDGEHDAQWWTAEMVRRLPDSCHAAVSVKVILLEDGASCGCPICGNDCLCTSCYA